MSLISSAILDRVKQGKTIGEACDIVEKEVKATIDDIREFGGGLSNIICAKTSSKRIIHRRKKDKPDEIKTETAEPAKAPAKAPAVAGTTDDLIASTAKPVKKPGRPAKAASKDDDEEDEAVLPKKPKEDAKADDEDE